MNRNSERPRTAWIRLAATGVLAAGLLAACGASPDEMVASAKQYIAAKDPNAAVIQLKNALQERPEHAEARFLLGTLSAEAGDFASAAKELERARNAGYPAEQVAPGLALAMLKIGEAEKVVAQFADAAPADPAARAAVLALVGDAQLAKGDPQAARKAYEAALAARSEEVRARVGLARLKAGERDLAGAKLALQQVVAEQGANADAHALLAAIALAETDTQAAADEYRRAIAADPAEAMNHFRLISLLLRQGDTAGAKSALEAMKKATGGRQVYATYLQSYIDFLERRDDAAAEGVAKVIGVAPDFLPARLLSGTIHLRKRDVNQALQQLGVVLSAQPDNPLARRLKASAHLLGRDPDKALETLQPLLDKSPDDPALLALAGQAHLAKGDFDKSADYFAKTVEKRPEDAASRLRLGVSRLGAGESEQAFADLEQASGLDEGGIQADVALAMARLRQGKPDDALAAVERILAKQPDNPLGPNLRGGALLAKGDAAAARAAFGKALAIDAKYLPAVVNLARIDLAEKQPAAAEKRLRELVGARPKDANAHLALADVLAKTGAPAAAIAAALAEGVKAVPDAQSLRIALVRFHTSQGQPKEALAVAQQALAAAPEDPNVLAVVGGAQIGAGLAEQAVSTLGKLASLRPESAQALLLLAGAHNAAGNPSAAEQTLAKAYRLQPELPAVAQSLVAQRLQLQDFKGAQTVAEEVVKRQPKAALGHLLAADVALKRSEWGGAARELRSALKLEENPRTMIALHAALSATGDAAAAGREAAGWIRAHPDDLVVRGYLAEAALRGGDFGTAVDHYKTMLKRSPDNPLLLNNLAWASAQAKDPKAIEYAERALALAPDNAAILDTAGMIRLDAGQREQALADLERAHRLAPKEVAIALNLARAYARTGNAAKAGALLDQLERDNPGMRGLREEVAKVRASL